MTANSEFAYNVPVCELRRFRFVPLVSAMNLRLLAPLLALLLLTGCEQVNQRLGLEDPAKKEARMEAEGKAVGSGCRQSGRAIEDCYSLYNWLPKAAVFAGWREMNDYMLANKLEEVEPKLPPAPPPETGKKKRKAGAEATETAAPDDSARSSPEKSEAAAKESDKGSESAKGGSGEKPAGKH